MRGPRLDAELVRRGLARSRTHATRLITDARVLVAGRPATKPAAVVDAVTRVEVVGERDQDWASRGGHKLIGALDRFGVDVTARHALDVGASTGGFTDVLLRRGAASVLAVDVGDGQLLARLRTDPRVTVLDRTNARDLTLAQVGAPADLIVADLSFISLRLVLPALVRCAAPGADLLPMVKPQFEVGRERLGAGGVVRDAGLRADAVVDVADTAGRLGWGIAGVTASPLPGPSGNVEYFLRLRVDAPIDPARTRTLVRRAVLDGPQ